MRPKVILPVLTVALAASVLLIRYRPAPVDAPENRAAAPIVKVITETADAPPAATRSSTGRPDRPLLSPRRDSAAAAAVVAENAGSSEEHDVDRRITELGDLGMSDDPAALREILLELTDGEPQIRKAAIGAAVQFGSRDAIPALQDAMERCDDPEDKITLRRAIEFLKLPSLLEAGSDVR